MRAHVFLCMLGYYVEWHLREVWAERAKVPQAKPVECPRRDRSCSMITTGRPPSRSGPLRSPLPRPQTPPSASAAGENNAVDYIFGLPGNAVLSRLLEPAADDVRVRRAEAQAPVLRRYAETRYGAKSWGCERRVAARIEASTMGLDIRCVVTPRARRNCSGSRWAFAKVRRVGASCWST